MPGRVGVLTMHTPREGCLAVRAHTAGGGVGRVLSPAGCCVECTALSLGPLVQLLLEQDAYGSLLLQGWRRRCC